MKKIFYIILIGLVLGFLDLIPLFFAIAPLFNMVSIIAFWLCSTLFIYKTKIFNNSILNGLIIAILLMIPMALAVSATNPKDFFPMLFMAIILGPVDGFLLKKLVK
ncbi:MAG: hypothetical protein WBA54_11015 [Acidaminobacteraceae bacterium]